MNIDLPTAQGQQPVADPYFIPATASLQERRPRTLKHGDTFAVFNRNGDILPIPDCAEGLYHRDTRYLSHLDLLLGGMRPILLSSTLRDDNATLTCDLTNPDLVDLDGRNLEHDMVHIRRTKFLWQAACYERIAVRNFGDTQQRLTLDIRFGADFADLFEVRGTHRNRCGHIDAPEITATSVTLAYNGLDGRRRTTRLRFDPEPVRLEPGRAVFELDLGARERFAIHMDIAFDAVATARPPAEAFFIGLRDARRALRTAASRAAAIESSNDIFNELVRRSVSDLYMLVTDTPQGPYPYAGIPWYSTAFGRDALITALLTLWLDPALARGVLHYLAVHQATRTDPFADAEPGKILHEVRKGEMAELGEIPFRHYYGSVDATPLFVMLAGAYFDRTDDLVTVRGLWPHIEAALHWMETDGDRDGDGFIEYFRMTDSGLANQGWKDSYDSVFHADGRTAEGPIALVEVQGYAYAARQAAARIARALGFAERATLLEAQAERLRARIEDAFWCERLGTYAIALDGEKQPCEVRSSNAGHLLLCGVPSPERAARVASQLLGSAFFSGWGIRTVGAGEVRYNPMSYHNGSVWPHDNALIGLGMARYGMRGHAARILEGLFEASVYIDQRRLPELLCGFPRRRGQGPTFYPVACAPQAWAAVAPLSLLQACFGLSFDTQSCTVNFDRPVMPGFAEHIVLHNLALQGCGIDIVLRGHASHVSMTVLSRRGRIRAMMMS